MTRSPSFIKPLIPAFTLTLVGSFLVVFPAGAADSHAKKQPPDGTIVLEGKLILDFDPSALADLGFRIVAQGQDESASADNSFTFYLAPESTLSWHLDSDGVVVITSADLAACGALLLDRPGERAVITNPTLRVDPDGVMIISTTLDDIGTEQPVFELTSIGIEAPRRDRTLRLIAELSLSRPAARRWVGPDAAGTILGSVTLVTELASPDRASEFEATCQGGTRPFDADTFPIAAAETAVAGPDVLVADLQSVGRFSRLGDITAYGVGTTACNIGTERASWISYTNKHPVIIQNLYRLKEDRFEQIGMAWVKHGFYAVSQSFCTPCTDFTDGSELGVGCSDPYSASLNAVQTNMSPRSLVNADNGYFPYPWSGGNPANGIVRRLQAHDADLEPTLNSGARYFIEGHYVTPGDCTAGTDENNASYREVTVSVSPPPSPPNTFNLILSTGRPTQRGEPAVRAWRDIDPSVVETDVRVPGEGLFILAAKASSLDDGYYRYSYALQNLNSDRSAQSFSVPLPLGAVILNSGFHDAEYHSGEPYNNADWSLVVTSDAITWSTLSYEENLDANALRYATVFTFWFEVNAEPTEPPDASKATIGFFKPGEPPDVSVNIVGPKVALIDCNHNQVPDYCDLDCGSLGCSVFPTCGGSLDCAMNANGDGNGVPDDCEEDCQPPGLPGHGIPDACDIFSGRSQDCQPNTVPDECEPDCDGDDVPDTCETNTDCDGDGVEDCDDDCPCTTPVNACLPPYGQSVNCCFPSNGLLITLTWSVCITSSGIPVCDDPPVCPGTPCRESSCRAGCLLGDYDRDGDLDVGDFCAFQDCFSGSTGDAGFTPPSPECTLRLDYDEDGDIDLYDYAQFQGLCTGP